MTPAIQLGLTVFLKLLDVATVVWMTRDVKKATALQDLRRDVLLGKITPEEAATLVDKIHVEAMAELDAAIDALPKPTFKR
jgi:hypothetical protein